jgi:O-antigen/teichoic acid export membrane protein
METGSAKTRVVRNVITTLATQLFTWLVSFVVTTLYLPRYVHDEGMGRLLFAGSFTMLAAAVAPLGTGAVLVKETARNRDRAGALLVDALALRIPLVLVLVAATCGVAQLMRSGGEMQVMIALGGVAAILGTINSAFAATLTGLESLPRQNLAAIIEKTLSAAIILTLILLRQPLWMIAGSGILPLLAQTIFYFWAVRGVLKGVTRPQIASLRWMAHAGLPFLGWGLFTTLYGQSDPLILKSVTDFRAVGWYGLAFKLEGATLFLPVAITTALLPTLARTFHESRKDQFIQLARRAVEIIMFCGVPIGMVMIAIPEKIIHDFLHYGWDWHNAVPVLRLAGFGTLLYYMTQLLGTLVTAADEQAKMFKATVAACCIGIPLCIAFSWGGHRWYGNGATGALLSDLILELFLIVFYLRLLPRGLFGGATLGRIARYVVAALPMAGFLHWAAGAKWSLLVAGPAAAVIYGAGCLLLRAVDRSDLAMLRGIMNRQPEVTPEPVPEVVAPLGAATLGAIPGEAAASAATAVAGLTGAGGTITKQAEVA